MLIEPPSFRGRIYRPLTKGKTPGIVLIPGLHANGINDPRFKALARAIVRQGFIVLALDIADFRHFEITEHGIAAIIGAARFMIERMPEVDAAKVGLYGISYSAGPVLIAASRPELTCQIAFVVSIGGYYHLRHPIEYVLTGAYEMDGQRIILEPHRTSQSAIV